MMMPRGHGCLNFLTTAAVVVATGFFMWTYTAWVETATIQTAEDLLTEAKAGLPVIALIKWIWSVLVGSSTYLVSGGLAGAA